MITEKIRIHYLQEAGFRKRMKDTVEPYLKKYRRCGWFTSYDGTQIFYCIYAAKQPKGSIVIAHGFSEFAEKYNEMVYYFLQAGYSVFIPEHRGHGRSQRRLKNLEKIYVKSFEEYVRDLRVFVKKIVAPYKNEMLLFAHSMGGAIGVLYLERYPDDFQKAVLSSPMIRMKVGNVPYHTAMRIAYAFRLLGFGRIYAAGQGGFDLAPGFERSCCLSQERYLYAYEKRLNDKRFRTSGAVYSWVAAAGKAAFYAADYRNIQKIKIPVLIFAAGREHMVDTDEICRFAGKLKHARLVWVLNAKHEIFNAGECARLTFFDEIFAFLQEKDIWRVK